MATGELELRLWAAPGHEPGAVFPMPHDGLALTRDLLGGDTRISRGENAVRVERAGHVTVRVRVPAGALVRPLVLADTTLATLQRDVPPSTQEWRVSPGWLDEPWAMASVDDVALALLPAAVWNEQSRMMHLVRMPRPTVVQPGSEATFVLPITIALAGAALEIATPDTSAPAASPDTCIASFDIGPLRRAMLAHASLDGAPPVHEPIWIPGFDQALDWPAAEHAVAERAPPGASWFLSPALGVGTGELLLLALQDAEDRWRLLGTERDHAAWVAGLTGNGTSHRSISAHAVPVPSADPPSRLSLATPERFGEFVTYDAATADAVGKLRTAAPSALSVLLLGESGTGKELLAAALHAESGRSGAFVPVSCAAIPENLMETELFGHVGGAYTGARGDRPGAFAAARGGTLFLDEIGDAPMSVQLGLLRALETRRIKPVGSDREVDVDVRVVAATSRDLEELVAAERFRFDLVHRIAQLVVRVPPLRDRPADIEWLAEDLLKAAAPARKLTPRARAALVAHTWPGNVRELRNTIERAVALGGTEGPLDAAELMLYSNAPTAAPPPPCPVGVAFPQAVVSLARRALADGSMPRPDGMAPKKARSWQRAAFLYLKTEKNGTAWPPGLMRQFQRLFGQLWATSESGRGVVELMLALGLYPSDDGDRESLRALLERAGVPGGDG